MSRDGFTAVSVEVDDDLADAFDRKYPFHGSKSALVRAAMEYAVENPGASDEEIGEHVAEQLERARP